MNIYFVKFNNNKYYAILEGKGAYKTRVDNATAFVQKHVHVMCDGKECSWNLDGTRHDKHKFNLQPTKKAKDAAINAMGLDINAILEQLIYNIHETEGDKMALLAETFDKRETIEIRKITREEYEYKKKTEIDQMIDEILKLAQIDKS